MSTRLEAAAPASHLSTDQVDHLRRLLVEEHALQQARAIELQDPVDLEPDLIEVLVVRCQESQDEIEAALARIDGGAYGVCSECGYAIPYERLEVVPATQRCVCCQADRYRLPR